KRIGKILSEAATPIQAGPLHRSNVQTSEATSSAWTFPNALMPIRIGKKKATWIQAPRRASGTTAATLAATRTSDHRAPASHCGRYVNGTVSQANQGAYRKTSEASTFTPVG